MHPLQQGPQQAQQGRNGRRCALSQGENTDTSGGQRFGLYLHNIAALEHGAGKFLYDTGQTQVGRRKIQQKIVGTQLKLGMEDNAMLGHTVVEKQAGTGLALQQDQRMLIKPLKGHRTTQLLCILPTGHKAVVNGDLTDQMHTGLRFSCVGSLF